MAAVSVSGIVAPGGPAFFFFFFLRLFVRSVEVMASLAGGAGTESSGHYFLSFNLKNLNRCNVQLACSLHVAIA